MLAHPLSAQHQCCLWCLATCDQITTLISNIAAIHRAIYTSPIFGEYCYHGEFIISI